MLLLRSTALVMLAAALTAGCSDDEGGATGGAGGMAGTGGQAGGAGGHPLTGGSGGGAGDGGTGGQGSFLPTDMGEELWAWGWAGLDGSNVTLVDGPGGQRITFMGDLSGSGNDFFNDGGNQPAYQLGLQLDASTKGGPYATGLPIIGVDTYQTGGLVYGNVFHQSSGMAAAADFYLASVLMNTRESGNRELFGTDANNFVRIDQERNDVSITIAGTSLQLVDASCPEGIMVLEIWRDSANNLSCQANGVDVTFGTPTLAGVFDVVGMGYDGSGTSQWDDYWMEFVFCDALPQESKRAALREYLRAKWNAY